MNEQENRPRAVSAARTLSSLLRAVAALAGSLAVLFFVRLVTDSRSTDEGWSVLSVAVGATISAYVFSVFFTVLAEILQALSEIAALGKPSTSSPSAAS